MRNSIDSKSYYAVIFTSQRSKEDAEGYEKMAEQMISLAKNQKGFRSVESSRDENGFGITISYWDSLEDIKSWKANSDHQVAQGLGRLKWYKSFSTKVCKVEREYSFEQSN